ncbi:hypothetical protein LIA77_00083 [Sarocladium implicatum]|nr:hypothetical protein LIA77_00083 [Sarocladium implicatum]
MLSPYTSTDQQAIGGATASTGDPDAVQVYRQQCRELQAVLASVEDSSIKGGGSSWTDVLQSMDIAQETYNQKRGRGKAENIHANKSTVATLEMLTDMIPDQDGLSVLRGGLKVVFKLVQRRINNREDILNAFEDIPLTFLQACEKLQAHPDDVELRRYVQDLFTTLVEHMPKLVNILLRQHKGSLPSRIFKQHPEHESSVISSTLEAVSRASRRISDRISVLEDKAIAETLERARFIGVKIEETSGGVQLLQQGQAQISRKLEEQSAQSRQEIYTMINMALDAKLQSWGQVLVAALGDPARLLADAQSQPHSHTQQLPWNTQEALPCAPQGPTACTDMFRALALPDPSIADNEIQLALQVGNKMRADHGHSTLEQAGYVLLEPRFREWIMPSNGRGDLILVHGRLGHRTEGKISGLSVIAALFSAVRQFPQFVVLHHFCGLHGLGNQAGSGPTGLLQTLIAQLLVYINGNSGFAVLPGMHENANLLEDVADGDFASLCWFFAFLFRHLDPDLVVYCIIDGIDTFEGDLGDWASHMRDVVDLLNGLAAEAGARGPVLKVLLTAAERSIKVHRQLDAGRQIWLSEDKRLPHSAHHSILQSDLDRAIAS